MLKGSDESCLGGGGGGWLSQYTNAKTTVRQSERRGMSSVAHEVFVTKNICRVWQIKSTQALPAFLPMLLNPILYCRRDIDIQDSNLLVSRLRRLERASLSSPACETQLAPCTVSQLLQAASRCRSLEEQCSSLKQELVSVHQRCDDEIQLARASEHQSRSQHHTLEAQMRNLTAEHVQMNAVAQQEMVNLHDRIATQDPQHKLQVQQSVCAIQQLREQLQAAATEKQQLASAKAQLETDLQLAQESYARAEGACTEAKIRISQLVSEHEAQSRMAADMQAANNRCISLVINIEQQQATHFVDNQATAAALEAVEERCIKMSESIKEEQRTVAALQAANDNLRQLNSNLEKERSSHEASLHEAAYGPEAAEDEHTQLTRRLESQASSHKSDRQAAAAALQAAEDQCRPPSSSLMEQGSSREADSQATAGALQAVEDQCRHLSSSLAEQRSSHEADSQAAAAALQAAEDQCRRLSNSLEEQRSSHEAESQAAAAALQAAEDQCRHLTISLEEQQSSHEADSQAAAAALQADEDQCRVLSSSLEEQRSFHAADSQAAAAALQAAENRYRQLSSRLQKQQSSHESASQATAAALQAAEERSRGLEEQHAALQHAQSVAADGLRQAETKPSQQVTAGVHAIDADLAKQASESQLRTEDKLHGAEAACACKDAEPARAQELIAALQQSAEEAHNSAAQVQHDLEAARHELEAAQAGKSNVETALRNGAVLLAERQQQLHILEERLTSVNEAAATASALQAKNMAGLQSELFTIREQFDEKDKLESAAQAALQTAVAERDQVQQSLSRAGQELQAALHSRDELQEELTVQQKNFVQQGSKGDAKTDPCQVCHACFSWRITESKSPHHVLLPYFCTTAKALPAAEISVDLQSIPEHSSPSQQQHTVRGSHNSPACDKIKRSCRSSVTLRSLRQVTKHKQWLAARPFFASSEMRCLHCALLHHKHWCAMVPVHAASHHIIA